MIRTPLGQYINLDRIYTISIVENESERKYVTEKNHVSEFWIQATYTDKDIHKLSKRYKTYEEAQKELDKMMSYAPAENKSILDLIDVSNFTITKCDANYENLILEIDKNKQSYTVVDDTNTTKYGSKCFQDFQKAIDYFNSIKV